MSLKYYSDFDALDDRFRVNLINALSGFKSANLIGSVCTQGQTNLAIISSVVHLGANPPLMAYINRPASVERHTLDNILDTGQFTLNHVNIDIIEAAHQSSARYNKEQSQARLRRLKTFYREGLPYEGWRKYSSFDLRYADQVVARKR